MIFDIWIEEWSKKSKKMPHKCQLFSENYDKGKAFSLVTKLINRKKGIWKDLAPGDELEVASGGEGDEG